MSKNINLELTKKLITIPSYVGKGVDERKIAQYLADYTKKYSWLKVVKQKIKDNRYNLILTDGYPTQILFCAHMDTVQPREGWVTNPIKPTIKNNKLYGLGATDMKGSLASLLSALDDLGKTQGLMILLYTDEEYDFLGMKKFVKEYKNKILPQLIVSADGYDLSIGNGCRGLIEITFIVQGQTGHAANPAIGKNAIVGSANSIRKLTNILENKYKNKALGKTTCNLAFLQGGLNLGKEGSGKMILGREGNNIADIAEFVLDIRAASPDLNASKVIELMQRFLAKEGLKLKYLKIRHDLGSWVTTKKELKVIEDTVQSVVPITYLNTGSFGYIDTQMLWSQFNKVPSFTFGAGNLITAHKSNEYVQISNLYKAREIYQALIKKFAKGGKNNHDRGL